MPTPAGANGPIIVNGLLNNYDRPICFDSPVAVDTGLYADPVNKTLAQLREAMMVRMGMAAMLASPPPGLTQELNSFLSDAQEQLYARYDMLRTERWWNWQLTAGSRFYDVPIDCTKALNFRKIRWAGITDNGGRAVQLWTASVALSLGVFVTATIPNGYQYEVTTAGTTGATEPTWPTTAGATVVNGTVTFTTRVAAAATWLPLRHGINPLDYTMGAATGIPTNFEIREALEIWPTPNQTYVVSILGHLGIQRFAEDTDYPTIDTHLLFLFALANAKAHRGQADAGNYAQMAQRMVTEYIAGSHGTKRYIPRASTAGLKFGAYHDDGYSWPWPRATWR